MKIMTLTYRRLPEKISRFSIAVLKETDLGVVTCQSLNPSKPLTRDNSVLLDKHYMGIFYCPFDDWHDIGAIYNREKHLTGYYVDICSPIQKVPDGYVMTDFFLDLWIYPDNRYLVLDQDEFDTAMKYGWMSRQQITNAKTELSKLIRKIRSHNYPTSHIKNLVQLPDNIDEIIDTLMSLRQEHKRTRDTEAS